MVQVSVRLERETLKKVNKYSEMTNHKNPNEFMRMAIEKEVNDIEKILIAMTPEKSLKEYLKRVFLVDETK